MGAQKRASSEALFPKAHTEKQYADPRACRVEAGINFNFNIWQGPTGQECFQPRSSGPEEGHRDCSGIIDSRVLCCNQL